MLWRPARRRTRRSGRESLAPEITTSTLRSRRSTPAPD